MATDGDPGREILTTIYRLCKPVRNDVNHAKTAMPQPHSVAILIFPGFQILDAAGPSAAFEIAERFRPGSYSVKLVAPGGGQVQSSAGHELSAEALGAN